MATCTFRVGTADTGNTPNTSGTFTPAVGDLLVVFVLGTGTSTSPGTLTSSVGGFTFTNVVSQPRTGGSTADMYCFIADALVASATSQTVTFTTVATSSGSVIHVYSVSGMTKLGAAALLQTAYTASIPNGNTPAATFSSAVQTGNPTLGLLINNGSSGTGVTVPSGWTVPTGGNIGYATPNAGAQVIHRDSGFTGTTVTWGSTTATIAAAIVLELDTSAGGAILGTCALTFAAGSSALAGAGALLPDSGTAGTKMTFGQLVLYLDGGGALVGTNAAAMIFDRGSTTLTGDQAFEIPILVMARAAS